MPNNLNSNSDKNNKDESTKKHGGGPKTPEGKARSSMNSLRHGLTGKTVVLPTEDPAQFQELIENYVADFKPETSVETDLVHELAICRWRLQRLWDIESWAFEITMQRKRADVEKEFEKPTNGMCTALAFMSLADDKSLSLLIRYETRLTRRYDQVLKEIKSLQDQRKTEQEPPPAKGRETNSPKPSKPPKPAPILTIIPPKSSPNPPVTPDRDEIPPAGGPHN
jgi:hypothetical protein